MKRSRKGINDVQIKMESIEMFVELRRNHYLVGYFSIEHILLRLEFFSMMIRAETIFEHLEMIDQISVLKNLISNIQDFGSIVKENINLPILPNRFSNLILINKPIH